MIKIGVIGTSTGNGHPYSYSAIFNGYNSKALKENCPYELIREYLPKYHKNKNSINGANVTHIWTQDKKVSKKIAEVSKIKIISRSVNDLIRNVDAIILARDDPQNYFPILEQAVKSRKPLFVDKQFVHSKTNFYKFKKIINKKQVFMFGSAIKFSKDIKNLKKNKKNYFNFINGRSKSTWLSYGNHLIDGIFYLIHNKVIYVTNNYKNKVENIKIVCENKLSIHLKFSKKNKLPIYFNLFKNKKLIKTINFENYFFIYKTMLREFLKLIKNKKLNNNIQRNFDITKIILAGEISKRRKGKKIYLSTI